MRVEPLYRVTFSTPESWSVRLDGKDGSEGQSFPSVAPDAVGTNRVSGSNTRSRSFSNRRGGTSSMILPHQR